MKLVTSFIILMLSGMINQNLAKSYNWKSKSDSTTAEEKAMACAPATELVLLQYNNVRALIETGGSMWQDRSTSRAFYRVPADGNLSVIYAGALWLGGKTRNSEQLKVAAVTFRQDGNDFWPGPLTTDGSAEVEADVCQEYDKFFLTERKWAELHRAYFDCFYNPTCEVADEFSGYTIPAEFFDYPAHGDVGAGQSYYLAPFHDYDVPGEGPNGVYRPEEGDHPWYDLDKTIDCSAKRREDAIPLFGDQNYWWVFNDKGNIHTESEGEPIGMEIQAQAFSFSTNDEINNMTFYNYVLINRGTTELKDTYFGQWVDADVGFAGDDYVGCDVQRGLGYAYNGVDFDSGVDGYGANPPAVGVDFFEGPYQDYDGKDNAGPENNQSPISYDEAFNDDGIPYKGLGIGYGDDVIDNERFGMRKFVYYNNNPTANNGDPLTDVHHYNYLTGSWRDGSPMTYGEDGLNPNFPETDFMFPGNSDVVGFGTNGEVQEAWDETVVAADRRFLQSAGPFSLLPGDYNNITVGVIYGRASSGGPQASVDIMKAADDKAQALFDNCFKIVSGPTAPDVTIQEMDQEVILYLSNDGGATTNNTNEEYFDLDPTIPELNSQEEFLTEDERRYKFQGYQIYQLAGPSVTVNELNNPDMAALVKTMDIADGITTIVNWELDPEINEVVPSLAANGNDEGIQHSISITEDLFATSSKQLVNYKTYYFMVLAYAYNNYEDYNSETRNGQDKPYLASRNSSTGAIKVYSCIPHPVETEFNGTQTFVNYGDGIELTRIEGKGNGSFSIGITERTENEIMSGAPWRIDKTTYKGDESPVKVKVIDPLALQDITFNLKLATEDQDLNGDQAVWELTDLTNNVTITSDKAINVHNEQLLLEYGISIEWDQYVNPIEEFTVDYAEPISASIEFSDPSQSWLIGYPDQDGQSDFNWIRSGTVASATEATADERAFDDYGVDYTPTINNSDTGDPNEYYESLLSGTIAPYVLVSSSQDAESGGTLITAAPTSSELAGTALSMLTSNRINDLNNVDIVLTSDKEKWTRCPVLEMQHNPNLSHTHPALSSYESDGEKMNTRRHPSVDKNGLHIGQEDYNAAQGDFGGTQPEGMGWFPGYAIDQDTGERLNMAFGEDSWLGSENGRDMIWNPTSNFGPNGTYAGGQHWVYVFRNARFDDNDEDLMPGYDEGNYMYQNLVESNGARDVFGACTWVGSAILAPNFELFSIDKGLIPSDARIKLRISKAYQKFSAQGEDTSDDATYELAENLWNPLYEFSTSNIATRNEQLDLLAEELADINVVPNPYYGFSTYESNKIDNRIKIINLPYECSISIYTLSGLLVRQYNKADETTFLDWDLKNDKNVPIASGVYLIHIKTDAGERILKWFGVMRPIDLDNF